MKLAFTPDILELVRMALREDVGGGDHTTEALIPARAAGEVNLVARSKGVVSGLPILVKVYALLDRRIRVALLKKDGDIIRAGTTVARIRGPLRSLLTGERVALNFLTHLSGVATLTHHFVREVYPYRVKIMDTRKTMPCMRALQKYAVRCGGGVNHRMNLSDAIMVKDNHLEAVGYDWEHIRRALRGQRKRTLVVEVDHLSSLSKALSLKPNVVLLDNMGVSDVEKAVAFVRRLRPQTLIEVSGGIRLDFIRRYARTGAQRISIGALTHSAPHLDFSMELARPR
ncbi:MAG: carboxylating nicotinate-nucleotide diphosphorylase [Candidatus Omnitrophica bacterium]|nr:carboxylating nicotinate-nucleotide diphosphorylase [Candidatus Omnitrophota bacterium]